MPNNTPRSNGIHAALQGRKSVRAFLDRPVSVEQIERILDVARFAPSGANTQPWKVAVVTGNAKLRIQLAMLDHFERGERGRMDYQYYPENWFSPYRERRRDCGLQRHSVLGIEPEEKRRQRDLWSANYRSFGAPVVMYFFMDEGLATGSFVDCGIFLQSLMLAAIGEGLATCAQASLGEYPDIVKRELGYTEGSTLLCGMALGYDDADAPVNSYRTPREEVHTFTRFFD